MKCPGNLCLIVIFLGIAFAPAWVAADEPLRLEVTEHTDISHTFTGIAKSYGLKITNPGNSDVAIERGISIERETSSGWVVQMAVQAVADCVDFDQMYHWKAPVGIAAHATLDIVSWDGFLCSGQCEASCTLNGQVGSGTYRFVILTSPSEQRIESPLFKMETQ